MTNDFIIGAASALKGFGLPVYIEEIPMNFKSPCFTLRCEGVKAEPYLNGFFKESVTIGAELYEPTAKEGEVGLEAGRNYRLSKKEALMYEALRFIEIDGRIYCAKEISSSRKSQTAGGSLPSDVEGLDGLLYMKAVYCRFVKKLEAAEEGGVMEELFQNYY